MKIALALCISGLVFSVGGFAAEPVHPLSATDAMRLTATASTSADHLRLAKFFELSAVKLDVEAKEHADMARSYRSQPTASKTKRPGASDTAIHCESLSQNLSLAAKDARALAGDHLALATAKR